MAGIYIHVPFCKKRCIYCDFYSTTGLEEKKDAYIQALCKELEMRKDYLQGEPIQTIYIGGGTPSQLAVQELNRIFETIRLIYGMDACEEVTLETNPDDLSDEYISQIRQLPINRLSMGIQTFNDATLQLLGRRHTAQQAIDTVKRCQDAGFENISIDLIYGLPLESMDLWTKDLELAINLRVPHISAYHLIYEENTPLWNMLQKHHVKEVDENLSLKLFTELMDELSDAGYEHYEISNFCKPGFCSKHNSSYWTGKKYLGCGPSAHSFDGNSRQWNVASLDKYITALQCGNLDCEVEQLDTSTRYNERIITAIRTQWGLSLAKLKEDFGKKYYDYCLKCAAPHIEQGTLEIKEDTLRLTRQGIFISDGIMSDLLFIS